MSDVGGGREVGAGGAGVDVPIEFCSLGHGVTNLGREKSVYERWFNEQRCF